MSIVPIYIPSPDNFFIYFLEGQVHKGSKLRIMTNMGKPPPHSPSPPPQHYNNCSACTFLILFKKLLAPPHLKKRAETAFYMRDYKGETIKLLPLYMTDFLFTEL